MQGLKFLFFPEQCCKHLGWGGGSSISPRLWQGKPGPTALASAACLLVFEDIYNVKGLMCSVICSAFIPPPTFFSSPPPSNHLLQHGAPWPCRKPLLQNLPPALVCSGRILFRKSISYFSMPLRACYFGLLSVDLLLLIICSSAIRENLLKFHSHPLPLRQRNHLGLQQY